MPDLGSRRESLKIMACHIGSPDGTTGYAKVADLGWGHLGLIASTDGAARERAGGVVAPTGSLRVALASPATASTSDWMADSGIDCAYREIGGRSSADPAAAIPRQPGLLGPFTRRRAGAQRRVINRIVRQGLSARVVASHSSGRARRSDRIALVDGCGGAGGRTWVRLRPSQCTQTRGCEKRSGQGCLVSTRPRARAATCPVSDAFGDHGNLEVRQGEVEVPIH
jgi:hypothetical protein